jgi:hypothetical protein
MRRPRWLDALIVVAILGVLAGGVWALWWDDLRAALHLEPGSQSPSAPTGRGQT